MGVRLIISTPRLDHKMGKKDRRSFWKRAPFITAVLLLFGVIFFVVGYGKEQEFLRLLRRSRPAWLLAAAALQGLTYVCAAAIWQRPLSRYGEHRPLKSLIPLGLAKLFTDQAVPSAGLSGTLLVARALKRRGISRDMTMTALLVGLVAYYLAYAAAVGTALLVLWFYGDLNKMTIILATIFSLLAAVVPLGVFWLHGHTDFKMPAWLNRVPGIKDIQDAFAGASTNMFSSPGLDRPDLSAPFFRFCPGCRNPQRYAQGSRDTGETFPQEKMPGVLPEDMPLSRRSNVLFMGSHVVSGSGRAVVARTGSDTELGTISGRLRLRPRSLSNAFFP